MPAQPPPPRHFSLAPALPAPRIQRFAARRISPLRRTRSASRHPSLYARPAFRSPPLSSAVRSVAAYPEIRRQANLSASPYPFRFPPSFSLCPPSLPLPAIFVGGAKRRRVSKRFAARRIFPLRRTRSASRHPSLYARPTARSPPFFAGDGSAGAAYPEIRRQANLPASPYPFRFSLSLPRVLAQPSAPRPFRWRREASPRIQKIRRQANLPALVGEDCQGGGRPPLSHS